MGQIIIYPESLCCFDCTFWCGRCTEPTLEGRKTVNRIATSDACSAIKTNAQTGIVQEAHV